MYSIYCSIKRKLAKGLWYVLLFLLRGTACSCTQEVQDIRSLLLLSRSVHKKFHPTYFAFFVKFTAHFACRIAYFFSLPILLKILLANFVKAYLGHPPIKFFPPPPTPRHCG